MPKTAEILRRGPWFADLPIPIQQAMLAAGTRIKLASGQPSFLQGSGPSGLHAVLSGQLKVAHVDRHGHDVLMALVRPSEWTGFLCCLDGRSHFYSAIAVEPTVIFNLHFAAVRAIFECDVATYKLLQRPELNAARALARFAIIEAGRPLAQRIAARLRDLGRWAYGPMIGPIAALDHISQEDLAMSAHASRQSVNMILRDFEAQGWIATGYGKISVTNSDALEAFADQGN